MKYPLKTLPMKNHSEAEFEKYIYKVIDKYSPVLLLQQHRWLVKKGCESKTALMECVFNYPYLNVTLKYSEECFEMWKNGKDVDPYILHEMCHPITDPLYSKACDRYASSTEILDERERLTDLISHIVLAFEKR